MKGFGGKNPRVFSSFGRLAARFCSTGQDAPSPRRNVGFAIAACGWAAAVFTAAGVLMWTSLQPGSPAEPPATLPASAATFQRTGLPTVFVELHPHCPCSRATIVNLEGALNTPNHNTNVVALIYLPQGRATNWTQTDTVQRLSAFPSVRTVMDPDGRTAATLGMKTSGQIVAYDTNARLVFSGGITPSRGHEGDSAGLEALSAVLAGRGSTRPATSVYGCPLCNEASLTSCAVPSNNP
jgi:hypothetical protein